MNLWLTYCLILLGLARLELGEMHEATAFISPMEERMPLVMPVRTKEHRGCVEKWMVQVPYF